MKIEERVNEAVEVFKKNWLILTVSALLAGVVSVVTLGIMAPVVFVGMGGMFLKLRKGQSVGYANLFDYTKRVWPLCVAMFLVTLGICGGMLLLVIPGLFFATMWLYVMFACAYGEKSALEAMKASWEMVQKNGKMPHFLMMLATGALFAIGNMLVIGTFIALPLIAGFMAFMYEDLK